MQKAARTVTTVYSTIIGKGRLVPILVLVSVLLTVVMVAANSTPRAHAATNSTINFQARVLTASGSVIPDGNVNIQFKLYDASSGGSNPWTETQNTPAKNGYVTVNLGSVTPFPGTIDWSQEHWLTLNINGDGEMGPTRMKVTGVPYSFRSGQADALSNGSGTLTAAGLAQLSPGSVQNVNSANAALRINQQGSGSLLQLQGNGTDVFTVSNAGEVVTANGLTIGNSGSATAGTLRWSGTDFQGYNGSDWVSLTGGSAGVLAGTNVTFTSGLANVGANVTGTPVEMLLFSAANGVSNTIGVTGFTAPADGSFRTCLVKNNAAITGGTLAVRWRVNGVSVGGSVCGMNSTTNRQSSSVVDSGVVNFVAGDTIGIAFDTVGLAPTTNDFTVYWSVEYTSGAAGGTTLQQAYDNSSTPALITSTNNKDLKVTLENTATDSNFLVDIASGSGSKFAVQNNGTDVLSVNSSGITANSLSVSGGINNNGGGISDAGNITGVGTNLTATGELTIASTGANSLSLNSGSGTIVLGASTLSRTSPGSTNIDLIDNSDTTLAIGNSGSGVVNLTIDGNVTSSGLSGFSGVGSGLTSLNANNISSGTLDNNRLDTDVTLLGNSFNGADQLVQLDSNGYLPSLNGSALTSLNASNISSGTLDDNRLSSNVGLLNLTQTYSARQVFSAGLTLGNSANETAGNIRWTGSDFEGYNGSAWISLTSGGTSGSTGAPGNVLSIIKPSDEIVNNSDVLQNDDHLKFDIEANGNLTFRFVVQATSGATTDIKFAVTAPSGAACDINFIDTTGSIASANNGCGVSSGLISSIGSAQTYEITGTIRNGSTAGSVNLQWTQNTADSSDTTVLSGSYVNMMPESNGSITPSNAFVQNGNSFGVAAIIGTTDSNELRLITSGATALKIDSTGDATFNGLLSVLEGASIIGGLNNNTGGISSAGNITGVGTELTATGALTIATTGATNDLTLNSASGTIVLGADTLLRSATGTTIIDLSDSSDTLLEIKNSNSGVANINVEGSVTATNLIGNGSALTSLNGTNVSSGTVADARLSSNVAILDRTAQTFSGKNSFSDNIAIGTTANANNKLQINSPNTVDNSAQQIIYTNAIANKGLVIQMVAGQNVNAFEVQNNSGEALGGFDKSGQLILGNDTATPQAGLIAFNDSTGANGFTAVLGVNTLTSNRNIYLPDEGGTLCIRSSASCGFIQLGPGTVQTDATTNPSIFINKSGASGNMITLQNNGTNAFLVSNDGALQILSTNTGALNVSNSGGTNYFNVDTSAGIVKIGGASADSTGVILVLDIKNTVGDPTGQEGAMYYNSSSGSFRCYQNSRGWTDCLGVPKPNTRRSSSVIANGTSTAYGVMGDIATIVQTTLAAGAATTTEPASIAFSTANATGGVAHISGNTNYNSNASPSYQTHARLNAITTARVWLGLTNQTGATMVASANPAGNYAAFRFDTGAGDNTWRCVTKDGTNQNIQNSGIAPVAGVGQKFEIIISGSNVEFKINGNAVCNNTTNLPSANTLLRYVNTISNLANGVRTLNVAWVYLDSDE